MFYSDAAGLIHGRMLVAAWEDGVEGCEDQVIRIMRGKNLHALFFRCLLYFTEISFQSLHHSLLTTYYNFFYSSLVIMIMVWKSDSDLEPKGRGFNASHNPLFFI